MPKYSMTVGELHKLHADSLEAEGETTGGFDYCILSDVRKEDDLCIVDIDAKTPPVAGKEVLPLTALNKATEAAKCKLTAAQVDKLGLAAKVVEKPVDVEPIDEIPVKVVR